MTISQEPKPLSWFSAITAFNESDVYNSTENIEIILNKNTKFLENKSSRITQ